MIRKWLGTAFHWTWMGCTAINLYLRDDWGAVLIYSGAVVAGAMTLVFVASLIPAYFPAVMKALPLESQRPYYGIIKKKLLLLAGNASPLVAFPMLAFIEFNLDEEFEKGGYWGAVEAFDKWIDSYPDRMMAAFEVVAEESESDCC